jgi:hypothetical protein
MGKRGHLIPAACSSGKRSYVDRQAARNAGRKAQQINGQPFDIYRHTSGEGACGQYHLTTRRKVTT